MNTMMVNSRFITLTALLTTLFLNFRSVANAGTVTASPSPACVGQEITVTVSDVTECEGVSVSAKIGETPVSVSKVSSGVWSGTVTIEAAGIYPVTALDNCGDTFEPFDQLVVQLDDITIESHPTHSQWH